MHDRFVAIESKIAFQEHTIDELNAVVTRQNDVIDALARRVETLERQLRAAIEDDANELED